jgi:hypothetical protein
MEDERAFMRAGPKADATLRSATKTTSANILHISRKEVEVSFFYGLGATLH